jgi:hypothetical protein
VTKRFPDRAAALAIGAALLAGCGGSGNGGTGSATATATGSGRPAYCAALSDLEKSVKALRNTNVRKNGTDALKSAASQVKTDATAVVSKVKSDFAPETSALKDSVHTLSTSVKQLASSPTTSELAALPAAVSSVSTASKNLKNAASTKCS